MSKRSQEKRRARAKEKKIAQRRMMGLSPLSRLAGDVACECWLGYEKGRDRMKSIQLLRGVRDGTAVRASFLLDYDGVGIKDAYYRLDADKAQFHEWLRGDSVVRELVFVRIELPEARRMVAAAAEWTVRKGFRLADDFARCVRILGGIGEATEEDLKAFGTGDGKLLYFGTRMDLERRLASESVEEFMARDDVEMVLALGDEFAGEFEEVDGGVEEGDEDAGQRERAEEFQLMMAFATAIMEKSSLLLWQEIQESRGEPRCEPVEDLQTLLLFFLLTYLSKSIREVADPFAAAIRVTDRRMGTADLPALGALATAWVQAKGFLLAKSNPREYLAHLGQRASELLADENAESGANGENPVVDIPAVVAEPHAQVGAEPPPERQPLAEPLQALHQS